MPKITYFCIDCGKESTPKWAGRFEQPRDKYRCYSCAAYYRFKDNISKTVRYTCIDCGKESKTDYKNHFTKPREEYRCCKCAGIKKEQNPQFLEARKKRYQDPAFREILSAASRKKAADPVWLENTKKGSIKRSQNPVWKERNKKAIIETSTSPKYAENRKKGMIKRSQNPEWQKMMREQNQKMYQTTEWKERQKNGVQKSSQKPEWRESNLIGMTGQGFWYGHPILKEKTPKRYCELWNRDLWNRIDAAWDFKSVISGKSKSENKGKQLCRHHVYWQEKACCKWDEDNGKYYAMIDIGNRGTQNLIKYYITDDPNKFVLLTVTEHGMVKGNKKLGTNKITWIKFFEEIIEQRKKENKKCYLSKEEYEIYKKENFKKIKQYLKTISKRSYDLKKS